MSFRAELEKNFEEEFSLLPRIGELLTAKGAEEAQCIAQNYSNDLEENLVQECVHFYSYVSTNKTEEKPGTTSVLSYSTFMNSMYNA